MQRCSVYALASLLICTLAACGDSTGTGAGGNGTGASSAGGNANGGNDEGGMGAGTTTNMGGSNTGGASACSEAVATNIVEGVCKLYEQTGCPSLDDTCEIGPDDPDTPEFDPNTICVTRNGLKAIGESCNVPDDCQKHLTCIGVCTSFCCKDDPNSCGGGSCNLDVTITTGDPPMETDSSFQACTFSQGCDLFTPDSCPADQNCYLEQAGVTGCYEPNVVPELGDGDECTALNECADSMICIQEVENDPFHCRFLCMVNSTAAPGLGGCPAGELCDANSFDSGFAGVGLCLP